MPVSGLFRDQVDPERRWPRPRYLVALGVSVALLVGLAVIAAYDRKIALIFVAAAAGAFALLRARRERADGRLPGACRARATRRRASRSPTSTVPAR